MTTAAATRDTLPRRGRGVDPAGGRGAGRGQPGHLGGDASGGVPVRGSRRTASTAPAARPRPRVSAKITELIAHGVGTGEIARSLHLSTHTVRGYVKAVFEKVGVSSRGELVARLFAERYAALHTDPASQERAGT